MRKQAAMFFWSSNQNLLWSHKCYMQTESGLQVVEWDKQDVAFNDERENRKDYVLKKYFTTKRSINIQFSIFEVDVNYK